MSFGKLEVNEENLSSKIIIIGIRLVLIKLVDFAITLLHSTQFSVELNSSSNKNYKVI